MKSFKTRKSVQILRGSLAVTVLLTAGIATAGGDKTSPGSENTQGAGATKLTSTSDLDRSGVSQPGDTKSFVREAIAGNSAEIAMAQVAERKAQNAELKQFAQTLKKEHEQANRQLQPIAQNHGLTVNQPLDSKHQKKLESLEKLSGAEFDKEYAKEMLKDHQKDVAKYEKASQHLTETDVKQYVQSTLPKLRQHLQHAQRTALAVGVDQATISSIMDKSRDSMGGTADELERQSDSMKLESDADLQTSPTPVPNP